VGLVSPCSSEVVILQKKVEKPEDGSWLSRRALFRAWLRNNLSAVSHSEAQENICSRKFCHSLTQCFFFSFLLFSLAMTLISCFICLS